MEKSIYEKVLEVGEVARKMDFEHRNEVENNKERQIKKIINEPTKSTKIPYEAYKKYMGKEE